jgi:beta-lysine 5,6-aminomutase beta subunit
MLVKPYGDTIDDGAVQLSFTLPVKDSDRAREAARLLVKKWGFDECEIVHAAPLSDKFSFFIAYGRTSTGIDLDTVEVPDSAEEEHEFMEFDQINEYIKKNIGRKVVVIGACTGFDAHTVGIDAIFNMKGYDHHYGLERYPMIDAHNMGAQVPNEEVIEFALKVNADAILISQIVTQRNIHIVNLTDFMNHIKTKNLRDRFVLIAGGPRIDNKTAYEIGFDAGFSKGTYAEHVATFIIKQISGKE